MIYGRSRNISISFTIISQKVRICKGFTRKSETKKLCKIVEILQVAVKRVKKAAPYGAALICQLRTSIGNPLILPRSFIWIARASFVETPLPF